MAGRGGDMPVGGSGPDRAGPEILRSWDAAEARLFPLVMARPEEYERSLAMIDVLLGWLRSRCPDIPSLLAQSARGGAMVADAAGELSGDQGEPRLDQGGLAAGVRA